MPLDTTSPKKALRVDRIAEIKRGERTAAGDKLTVSDLLDLVVTDYEVNNCRSLEGTIGQLEAVRVALGTRRASDVATEAIKRMQARWLEAEISPATVNRRCDKLRRRPSGVEAIRLRRRLEEGVGAGDGAGRAPRGAESRRVHVPPHQEHGGD